MRTTRWQRWSGLLFIMPWLITFLWFTLGPFIASIFLSFTNYRFIGTPTWVGFQNYANLFGDDPKFIRSIINTLYYTAVHVPGIMLLAFFVALLLNQKVKGQAIYRTAFYLPSVTAGVATAYLWILLLQPNGLINQFLGIVGDRWSNLADELNLGHAGLDPYEFLGAGHDDDHLSGSPAGHSTTPL